MRVFIIPANFATDMTILRGRLKLNRAIEGLILALFGLPLVLLIGPQDITEWCYSVSLLCGPLFLFGVVGFNGDSLSVTLKSANAWLHSRSVMIYNPAAKPLRETPLEQMEGRVVLKDKLLDYIDERKAKKEEERLSRTYIEGVNFNFIKDTAFDFIPEEELQGTNDTDYTTASTEEAGEDVYIETDTPSDVIIETPESPVVKPSAPRENFGRIAMFELEHEESSTNGDEDDIHSILTAENDDDEEKGVFSVESNNNTIEEDLF